MRFADQIQSVKKDIAQAESIERSAQKLPFGIRNHILSLASTQQRGRSFSCDFDVCLGSANIDYFSIKNVSGYLSKKEIYETNRIIAELYRKTKTEIGLSSEAFELHRMVQSKLKKDGIEVSDIFVGKINQYNAAICDGDYRIGWCQARVVFELQDISRKTSTVLGSSVFDPNTIIPLGTIQKRYSYNPHDPLICIHKYRKRLFDYSASAYLVQNTSSERMSTSHGYGAGTIIAYCFKVKYTDK